MIRLTTFEKYIIWFIINISALVYFATLPVKEHDFSPARFMGITFSTIFLFFASVVLSWDLKEIIAFKYKIVENSKIVYEKYEVKVLRIWWLFIVAWMPVVTKWHSYEAQNIFGATLTEGYDVEVGFNKAEDAMEAIQNHKQEIKENRKKFFKRPAKDKVKTTYL